MGWIQRRAVGFALSLLVGPPMASAEPLGRPPLCEASSAIRSPWLEGDVLVADNKVRGLLFAFRHAETGLVGQSHLEMPSGNRPRDLEAMAAIGRELFVFGSHSRNSLCKEKPKRRRMRGLSWAGTSLAEVRAVEVSRKAWRTAVSGQQPCLAALFTKPAPDGAEVVCKALLAAEAGASAATCRTLDIEGAAATPGPEGARIWLGLRRPLADGKAILLRLAPGHREMRWDAVAFADLGGRGVRALDPDGDRLWGIAGPCQDAASGFALWSVPIAALSTGQLGVPPIERPLPPSSEGLIVERGRALVVTDGGEGDSEAECRMPASQHVFVLGEAGD